MVAGRLPPLFSTDGYQAIYEFTNGNPAKINTLCYPAMNYIASTGKQVGDKEDVIVAVGRVKKFSQRKNGVIPH